MPTMKLNHVALTVSDRPKSADFYAAYFGMTKRVHDDDHILILSNEAGCLLALSEGDVPLQPPRTSHFGFEIETADAVHAMRSQFKADGIEEAEWQEKGPTRVQVFDPDGYRVEVYGW